MISLSEIPTKKKFIFNEYTELLSKAFFRLTLQFHMEKSIENPTQGFAKKDL